MAAGTTEIQWTWKFDKAGKVISKGRTWNVGSGCKHKGPECNNCYAEALHGMRHEAYKAGKTGLPKQYARPFSDFQMHTDRLDLPLRWREGCRIFVNSMTDTFHEDAPEVFIAEIFATMALARHHTFLVLTKRAKRMHGLLNDPKFRRLVAHTICSRPLGRKEDVNARANLAAGIEDGTAWPLPNVWLGVSAGTQATANRWIPFLLGTPAAIRFVSMEPLLEQVDISHYLEAVGLASNHLPCGECGATEGDCGHDEGPVLLDWVIVGGESGAGAKSRPMHLWWARRIRDACKAAGVPFFFKQWGDWTDGQNCPGPGYPSVISFNGAWAACSDDWMTEEDHGPIHYRVGKKTAGRMLDGVEHSEYPEEIAA